MALEAGPAFEPWAEPQAGRACRARRRHLHAQPDRERRLLPDRHDLRLGADAAARRRRSPRQWLPRIYSRATTTRAFVPAREKTAALIGMGMTENQGGSDLRTNTTRAEPAGDGTFRLHGHKWFMSAPMCDAFLVLAQAAEGPELFPDAALDAGRRAQRHAASTGSRTSSATRSNASSEVEFDGAYAQAGRRGRAAASRPSSRWAIYTRLDCAHRLVRR